VIARGALFLGWPEALGLLAGPGIFVLHAAAGRALCG
jgi:hypothetical protein